MHLTDFLAQQQVEYQFLHHAPAFSAPRLARQLGLPGDQVARTVLLRTRTSFLLAVLPSTHQVDTDLLAPYLSDPVRLATAEEAAEVFHDCEFGKVPPFGRLYGLESILDASILPDAVLVF